MEKFKKFLVIIPAIIAVLILISVLVDVVSAYNTSQGKTDLEYVIDETTKTITITGFSSDKTTIKIPETILGNTVVAIEEYAFQNNTNVTAIYLPQTIQHIGTGAFYGCENLWFIRGLEKCGGLTKIENKVFYNCKRLKQVKLPNNITFIGDSAFKSCHALEELIIPNSVLSIGKQAFDNCQSVKKFIIPDGVKTIKEKTFHACLSLKSVTLPEGITHIDNAAFANCYELEEIEIPSTVEVIGKQAFTTCKSLSTIVIPEGVREIREAAFIECYALTEITFPASLERLDAEVFRSNTALKSINVASNNAAYTSIDGVLYNKNLTELIAYPGGKTDKTFSVLEGVAVMSNAVFAYNENLDTLNIPASVHTINDFFLYESSIKTINYGGTVADWNKIKKVGGLDFGEFFQMINCTDGQISKDGTITYYQ